MGCHILEDTESSQACFYCSTSDWAFGPVMEDREQAERFLKYLEPVDPRVLTDNDLMARWIAFQEFDRTHCHDCGEPNDYRCPHNNCKGCGCAQCDYDDAVVERRLDRETP